MPIPRFLYRVECSACKSVEYYTPNSPLNQDAHYVDNCGAVRFGVRQKKMIPADSNEAISALAQRKVIGM